MKRKMEKKPNKRQTQDVIPLTGSHSIDAIRRQITGRWPKFETAE